MARVSYVGIRDPKAFFEALKPFRQAVLEAKQTYRPFGPHYNMLSVITAALDAAAEFFAGNRAFYSLGDSAGVGRPRTDVEDR